MNRHEFALYVYGLTELLHALPAHGRLCIKSKDMHHRISRILRLQSNETIILFDQKMHAQCILDQLKPKDELDFILLTQAENTHFFPYITVGLPLLKREALEAAIYGLVEVGASAIQLVTTEKSQQRWQGEKEYCRLQRIMIAAAEQAKNYAFPDLSEPISLKDFIEVQRTFEQNKTIFFDPNGVPVSQVVLSTAQLKQFTLLIGPEADLSPSEKKALVDASIEFCSLTPTILRAQQAAVVSTGIFRSFFSRRS